MKSIPVVMRERILQLYAQGKTTAELAAFSGFCVAAVRRVRQHFKTRGTVKPQTHLCGRKTLLTDQRKTHLQKLVVEPTSRLVFVDESGANTKMTRLGGRAPVGARLVTHLPHGHYQTSTLIAAVRLTGACAPWLFAGAMDGELFLAWVRQGLVPTLQPGDLVIMDNLATHKVTGVREAIESAGARLLYLPPYSPDFNPIENMWSKIKKRLRSLAPRTSGELLQAAAHAFDAISTTDCQGCY